MEQTGKAEVSRECENPKEPKFSVAVTPFEREGSNILGLARIYFEDCFVVSNVSILKGREKEFVAMPSYMVKQNGRDGKAQYQDVCFPVTRDFRDRLYGEILKCYEKEKEKMVSKNMEVVDKQRQMITENRQFHQKNPFR